MIHSYNDDDDDDDDDNDDDDDDDNNNEQNWKRCSQWPRCLCVGSVAALFLGLWVRIPLVVWMSTSCECCVLLDKGLCDWPITRPEEPYRVWRV